jgi:hypothetical protein
MLERLRQYFAGVVYRSMQVNAKPGRPGLFPLPWSGPAGEAMVAVIDLDGSLIEVVGTRSPRQLSRLIDQYRPGGRLPGTLRRYLRSAAE